jgi:hypothetical protein
MALERARASSLARIFAEGGPAARLELLRALWPVAVGAELARRTELIGIESGTLRVRVPDGRWRRALFRMQRDLLARLRSLAGGLAPQRLGFTEGPLRHQPPAPAPAPPPAPEPPVSPDLRAAAEAIGDAELRQRFLSSAARYLARSRRGT